MILSFEEYCNNEWTTDFDIVNESMSISNDVAEETQKILDLINSLLKGTKNIKEKDDGSFKFIKNPVVKVFGCDCELDFTFVDYLKRGTIAHCQVNFEEVNGIVYTDFCLRGHIQVKGGKVSERCAAVIGHELMHAYMFQKIYNNVPYLSAEKIHESQQKWRDIYDAALSYVDKAASGSENYSESILDLMYNIYNSDVSEVSAFTQEAYEQCRECKTISAVKDKIQKTTIYKMKESFKIILDDMDYLMKHHRNQYEKFYNKRKQMVDECSKLPSAHQLQKLFTKRYNKVLSNIGKIISYIKYELEDKDTVKTVIKKY